MIGDMTQLTIQFGPTDAAQADLQRALAVLVKRLGTAGLLRLARVEPVFPGDETEDGKGAFVITFRGAAAPVAAAFNELPGVAMAYVAPSRESYSRA